MEIRGGRAAEVLLVEDSEDDVFLTRKSFENAKLAVNLHHVENGMEGKDGPRLVGGGY